MKFAKLQLGTWGFGDLVSTLFSLAVLVAAEALFLSKWLSPSAMVAGCSVALVAAYLHQCGNSLFRGALSARFMFLAVLFVVAIIAGGFATMVFGK